MDPTTITLAILTHPFQVLLAVLVFVHAARRARSRLFEGQPSRPAHITPRTLRSAA